MKGKNGFFKLNMREEGVFLQAFSPEEGGSAIDVKEVIAYLNTKGFNQYDLKELNRTINTTEEMAEVYIGEWQGEYEKEGMTINVSSDKMLAFCRFIPPSNKGQLLTEEEIIKELEEYHVVIGIDIEEIRKFLNNRYYCTNYVLAKGIPPVNGVDAKIEYFFNTNPNLKPKRNEDGTVDYHELNTISQVVANQVLAKLHNAVCGIPGQTVFGGEIPARQEKSLKLEFGKHIILSEDKTEIISEVSGHATLINGKVFVSEVFEVPANVDNATGDINYDGNVFIKGNVQSGFTVTAKGDIVIDGVVEAAFLSAGGQIIVKRGIHGMNKGKVSAEGNIITKFIENAVVVSGGFVEAGSIIHSQVSAMTEVRVNGKKGFIAGGVIRSGNLIDAQTIGSEMGTITKLEVGVNPAVQERYAQIQKEVIILDKEMEQIKPILMNFSEKMGINGSIAPERMKQIQLLAAKFKENQQKLLQLREEHAHLYENIQLENNAKIKVKGNIYPGVSIAISDISMHIKKTQTFSKFIKEQGEIIVRPL
ncbi:MAG: FapA family protein [Lachnospiraceae bacterium]